MTPADTSVTVQLRDGQRRPIDREQIFATAAIWTGSESTSDTSADADSQLSVIVNDQAVEALPLVARALKIDSDLLRPRSALEALHHLGFKFENELRNRYEHDDIYAYAPARGTHANRPGDDDPADLSAASRDGDTQPQLLSPELSRNLQRHRGRWVAIRDNALIASADTLRELREQTGPGPASVMFVPVEPPSRDS